MPCYETIHDEKKLYQCEFCDQNYFKKAILKKHVESVHEKKELFECTICEHNFLEKKTLNRHLESVHEGKKPSSHIISLKDIALTEPAYKVHEQSTIDFIIVY